MAKTNTGRDGAGYLMARDAILHAPAADRNKEAILRVLAGLLPARGNVLEIASGTGQHVAFFAKALPDLQWQPTDPEPAHRASIAARTAEAGLGNVRPPLDLDVFAPWPHLDVDAVVVANLVHVSPAGSIDALCAGAARVLLPEGVLCVYGPFNRNGRHTSGGNARFDRTLREQNPNWGLRDVETLLAAAEARGLAAPQIIEMPANNLLVVVRKSRDVSATRADREPPTPECG